MTAVSIDLLSSFVVANHIMAQHDLVDTFGHISLRLPNDPESFLYTGPMGAQLMHDVEDIAIFAVEDGSPVGGNTASAESPYSERFIHSEIYKMYPGVQSVLHSHSIPVIAQGVSDLELRALWHMAGFIGEDVPVFDPRDLYLPGEEQNLLVNNERLGEALAAQLNSNGNGTTNDTDDTDDTNGNKGNSTDLPEHAVILQRGHGFVTWGISLEDMVYRGIYTQQSARIQQRAEVIGDEVTYLTPQEIEDTTELDTATAPRAWAAWHQEVAIIDLYRNEVPAKGSKAPGGKYVEEQGDCTRYEYEPADRDSGGSGYDFAGEGKGDSYAG